MKNILVLHGPNLNLLGIREPSKYGTQTLTDINKQLTDKATSWGWRIHFYQSNNESELIHRIHQALTDHVDYMIINPAAFTHTSIAMRDALLAVNVPFIEIHISNIHARESFRQQSYFSDIARGVISGLGSQGYCLALDAIRESY